MSRTLVLDSPTAQRDSGFCEESLVVTATQEPHPQLEFVFHGALDAPKIEDPEELKILDSALENAEFMSLQGEEQEEFSRIARFEYYQKKALSTHHEWTLRSLSSQLVVNKEEAAKEVGFFFNSL